MRTHFDGKNNGRNRQGAVDTTLDQTFKLQWGSREDEKTSGGWGSNKRNSSNRGWGGKNLSKILK